MTHITMTSIVRSVLALTLILGLASVIGCGNEKSAAEKPADAPATAEKAPEAAPEVKEPVAKEQTGLDMGEKLALTQHFEEKAKADISADNAAAELEKLAKEIDADQ